MDTLLISIAILPVVILAVVVYRQDKIEKEPFGKLLLAFFMGCVSVLPAVGLETILSMLTPDVPILRGLWDGYIVAGCSEEFSKLLMLYLAIWKSREFNEYFDGIVYACFVSLGFACVENIGYVAGAEDYAQAMMTGTQRAILSVPGHFLFGVMMGYHFALAKFIPERRGHYLFMAFLIPMLLHGTFDALLMVGEDLGSDIPAVSTLLFIVFIFFDIRLWKWGMRRTRRLQELSRNQDVNRSNPFEGFKWYV